MAEQSRCRCLLSDPTDHAPKCWLTVIILYILSATLIVIGYFSNIGAIMGIGGICFWPAMFISLILLITRSRCMCTCDDYEQLPV